MGSHQGAVLWFTGLSGAGKSTLAEHLVQEFRSRGYKVELLDGDEIRTHLSAGLSFSKEDRDTNVRRIGWVARVLARNGVLAVTAAISPYRAIRDEIPRRDRARRSGCLRRDLRQRPAGRRGCAGCEGPLQEGVGGRNQELHRRLDPYEAPENPEVRTALTSQESIQEFADRILNYLTEQGIISAD